MLRHRVIPFAVTALAGVVVGVLATLVLSAWGKDVEKDSIPQRVQTDGDKGNVDREQAGLLLVSTDASDLARTLRVRAVRTFACRNRKIVCVVVQDTNVFGGPRPGQRSSPIMNFHPFDVEDGERLTVAIRGDGVFIGSGTDEGNQTIPFPRMLDFSAGVTSRFLARDSVRLEVGQTAVLAQVVMASRNLPEKWDPDYANFQEPPSSPLPFSPYQGIDGDALERVTVFALAVDPAWYKDAKGDTPREVSLILGKIRQSLGGEP